MNWLYPPRCPICDQLVEQAGCCSKCYKLISFVKQPFCYCCGKPLEIESQEYCGDCKKYTKTFEKNRSLFLYDDVTKPAMMRFKFQNRREYAHFFAEECVSAYGEELLHLQIDKVMSVPMHPKKKRDRGYNQADLVAKELCAMLNLDYDKNGLERRRNTLPQKELNNVQRLKNLEKAFVIGKNSVKLKKILLVDDIYTTGTTMEACSRVLKAGGALKVYGLTVSTGQGY